MPSESKQPRPKARYLSDALAPDLAERMADATKSHQSITLRFTTELMESLRVIATIEDRSTNSIVFLLLAEALEARRDAEQLERQEVARLKRELRESKKMAQLLATTK